jgi:hypothetical protein
MQCIPEIVLISYFCALEIYFYFFVGSKLPLLFFSHLRLLLCVFQVVGAWQTSFARAASTSSTFQPLPTFRGWGCTTCTHSCGLDTLGRDIFDIFSSTLCENLFNSIRAHILEFLFSPSTTLLKSTLENEKCMLLHAVCWDCHCVAVAKDQPLETFLELWPCPFQLRKKKQKKTFEFSSQNFSISLDFDECVWKKCGVLVEIKNTRWRQRSAFFTFFFPPNS